VLTVASIGLWFIFREHVLLLMGLALGGIGLFVKPWAHWVDRGWRKLSEAIGWVMSRVMLGTLFFLLLTPLALLSRLSGRDPLRLKPAPSYWVEEEKEFSGKDLENMW
jgi:hypothetical protein